MKGTPLLCEGFLFVVSELFDFVLVSCLSTFLSGGLRMIQPQSLIAS